MRRVSKYEVQRGALTRGFKRATDGEELTNVLTVQSVSGKVPGFLLGVPDNQNAKSTYAFWAKIAGQVVIAQAATSAEEDESDEARVEDEL